MPEPRAKFLFVVLSSKQQNENEFSIGYQFQENLFWWSHQK